MKIEVRTMFRSNGLIDDLVIHAKPNEYLLLADLVEKAIASKKPIRMKPESEVSIEVTAEKTEEELFTSLQNEQNEYYSMEQWNNRNILRVFGNDLVLAEFQAFLKDLATRAEGYSYINEYSESHSYSSFSPECRLHVEAF